MSLERALAHSVQPAFTHAQSFTITTWKAAGYLGLRARILTHHPDFLGVAELFQKFPPTVRYLINPTDCGTVFMVRASGGAWELATVERALAKVLKLEQRNLAVWSSVMPLSPASVFFTPRQV